MTLELAMIVDSCVGLPSSAVMVPMVIPSFVGILSNCLSINIRVTKPTMI